MNGGNSRISLTERMNRSGPKLEKEASSSVEGGICGSGNGAKKPDNDDVRLVTVTSRGLAAASLIFNYADDDNMNEEAVCSSVM